MFEGNDGVSGWGSTEGVEYTMTNGTTYLRNAYDAATGRLTRQTYGNGTRVEYYYNKNGRTPWLNYTCGGAKVDVSGFNDTKDFHVLVAEGGSFLLDGVACATEGDLNPAGLADGPLVMATGVGNAGRVPRELHRADGAAHESEREGTRDAAP